MTKHVDHLVLFNVMQLQLAEHSRYHIGIELTPETRFSLIQSLNQLREKIAAPQICRIFNKPEAPPFPNVLNVIVIGARGSGKSTYIKRYTDGGFERKYLQTTTPDPYTLEDVHGRCHFNIRDFGGDRTKIDPELFEHANTALLFYDVTYRGSYDQIPDWIDMVLSVAPDCHIIICANKVDIRDISKIRIEPRILSSRTYMYNHITYLHMQTSAKSNWNDYAPFIATMKHFTQRSVLS